MNSERKKLDNPQAAKSTDEALSLELPQQVPFLRCLFPFLSRQRDLLGHPVGDGSQRRRQEGSGAGIVLFHDGGTF